MATESYAIEEIDEKEATIENLENGIMEDGKGEDVECK